MRNLTTNKVFLVLSGELFERLALGLGDQQGGENTGEHEEGEDLETRWRKLVRGSRSKPDAMETHMCLTNALVPPMLRS